MASRVRAGGTGRGSTAEHFGTNKGEITMFRRHGLAGGLAAGALVLAGVAAAAPAAVADPPDRSGDVIRTWTGLAMQAVRDNSDGDAKAARAYAMVDVAMYDAANGIAGRDKSYAPALVAPQNGTAGDPMVAASRAAHDVLTALYGDHASYNAQLDSDRARGNSPAQVTKGEAWGAFVAQQVVAVRTNDGLAGDEKQTLAYEAGSFDGTWTSQPRHMAPFAIDDPGSYVAGPPPALTSPEYTEDFKEVKAIGDKFNGDAAGEATYNFWALGSGRNQPAGAWLQVAQTVSADRSLSLIDTARLFALESMALADTVAATYETKWYYHGWRPQSAIRHASEDGNNDTEDDDSWTARGGAGTGSPQYYSGHSAFSAAGAQVLASFFCNDNVTFTLDTDNTGTGDGTLPRTYSSFSQAAAEAGLSRIYGGQHFQFGNQAGLVAGRAIADEVTSTALQPAHGPAQQGNCLG